MAAAEAASAVRRAKGPRPLWRTRAERSVAERARRSRSVPEASDPLLLARAAPARRLRVARRPHGLRARWARPSADRRIRGAPPTASRRSAAPKGLGETELPRRHVRPRACTDIDTEAQKKAAENQRLVNVQRNDYSSAAGSSGSTCIPIRYVGSCTGSSSLTRTYSAGYLGVNLVFLHSATSLTRRCMLVPPTRP